jgi:hypothetical protein
MLSGVAEVRQAMRLPYNCKIAKRVYTPRSPASTL